MKATIRNTDSKGMPAKTEVYDTEVGYIIRQRLFVKEMKGEKLLRKWKDLYYVERYIFPTFDTFDSILTAIIHMKIKGT